MTTPNLDRLMSAGIVRHEGYEYIGTTSDGVELTIGCVLNPRDLQRLETWLSEFPNPELW